MDYDTPLVRSFAARTRKNLEYIEKQQELGEDVFEVTQLINSLLGLLVFPREIFIDALPDMTLIEAEAKGWPKIEFIEGHIEPQNIKSLVRFLRNGIAHFNIEFIANDENQIHEVEIWNTYQGKTRKAKLTLDHIRQIAYSFIDFIGDIPSDRWRV